MWYLLGHTREVTVDYIQFIRPNAIRLMWSLPFRVYTDDVTNRSVQPGAYLYVIRVAVPVVRYAREKYSNDGGWIARRRDTLGV